MPLAIGPNPQEKHPMAGFPQVCYIKNTVHNPQIEIGDYTYYDDPEDAENFERNVLYLYPFLKDKLIIGKFCAIATGVKFIMNGGNHKLSGFSTYPFQIFGNGWERVTPKAEEFPQKGNTVVGHDVWLGYHAMVMPGVQIGHGAIIAANSLIVKDVAPYTVVGGNPARLLKPRFEQSIIEELLTIAWWDWDLEKISRNLEAIVAADINLLRTSQ